MGGRRVIRKLNTGRNSIHRKIVQKKANIPVLMVEADMVDPRSFSQSQVETRIDAFMEIIKQNY